MSSFLPNVVQLGWGGDNGWGTSIGQTIYMTVWPAIIGGLIGLAFGVALVVTEPGAFWKIACSLTSVTKWFQFSGPFRSSSYWPLLPQ